MCTPHDLLLPTPPCMHALTPYTGRSPVEALDLLLQLSLLPVILPLHPAAARLVGQEYAAQGVACARAAFNLLQARDVKVRPLCVLLVVPVCVCVCGERAPAMAAANRCSGCSKPWLIVIAAV